MPTKKKWNSAKATPSLIRAACSVSIVSLGDAPDCFSNATTAIKKWKNNLLILKVMDIKTYCILNRHVKKR